MIEDVLLCYSPSYFMRQGFSLNLKCTKLARALASKPVPYWSYVNAVDLTRILMLVGGYTLCQVSHLPGSQSSLLPSIRM